MQVHEITDNASLNNFVACATVIMVLIYSLRLLIRSSRTEKLLGTIASEIRQYTHYMESRPIPASKALVWAWARGWRIVLTAILFLGCAFVALGFLWTKGSGTAYEIFFSFYIFFAFIALAWFLLSLELVRDTLRLWNTATFLAEVHTSGGFAALRIRLLSIRQVNRFWRLARTFKRKGFIFILSLFVAAAPLVSLWAQYIDFGFKVALTVFVVITALIAHIAFRNLRR
jgi:uncharacterized membrane protein